MAKFMEKKYVTIFFNTFVTVLLLSVFASFLLTLPVMWLWNWLMPKIFGLTTLTFWQTFGLSFLCSMLFGKVNYNK